MESIAVKCGNEITLRDDTLQNSHNSENLKISRNNSSQMISNVIPDFDCYPSFDVVSLGTGKAI